jgi:hypothetical protein
VEPAPDPRFRRWVLIGAGFLAWNVLVLTLAIAATSRTNGENIGKFVGTVGSAIAFIPPAWFVWRKVQEQADRDKRARANFYADQGQGQGRGQDQGLDQDRLATEGTSRQD